jgi:hypothetical protein
VLESLVYARDAAALPDTGTGTATADGAGHVTLSLRAFLALPPNGVVRWLLTDATAAGRPVLGRPRDEDGDGEDEAGAGLEAAWLARLRGLALPYLRQRHQDRVGMPYALVDPSCPFRCSRAVCGTRAPCSGAGGRAGRDSNVAGAGRLSGRRGADIPGPATRGGAARCWATRVLPHYGIGKHTFVVAFFFLL